MMRFGVKLLFKDVYLHNWEISGFCRKCHRPLNWPMAELPEVLTPSAEMCWPHKRVSALCCHLKINLLSTFSLSLRSRTLEPVRPGLGGSAKLLLSCRSTAAVGQHQPHPVATGPASLGAILLRLRGVLCSPDGFNHTSGVFNAWAIKMHYRVILISK